MEEMLAIQHNNWIFVLKVLTQTNQLQPAYGAAVLNNWLSETELRL
jgi:hypothetical protein